MGLWKRKPRIIAKQFNQWSGVTFYAAFVPTRQNTEWTSAKLMRMKLHCKGNLKKDLLMAFEKDAKKLEFL